MDSSDQKKTPKASIYFMIFGLLLIFAALFIFQNHTEHAEFSSMHPQAIQKNREALIENERKLLGIRLNNERISAEVDKDAKLLKLGNKSLTDVEPPDPLIKDVPLTQEPNTVGNLREKSREEDENHPDVLIPHELEADHRDYESAVSQEQNDKRKFLQDLQHAADEQNLDMEYDAKTGEISIDRKPQNVQESRPGHSK